MIPKTQIAFLIYFLLSGILSNVHAQETLPSDETCDLEYLSFLKQNSLHSLVVDIVEKKCPLFVTNFIYAESLLKTESFDKLKVLLKSNLLNPGSTIEQTSLNVISQDVHFREFSYQEYRLNLPSINSSEIQNKELDRTEYLSFLETKGLNFRYVNVDILFAIKESDIDYLTANQSLLSNSNLILYPEVKSLYEKVLIPDTKVASPVLSSLFSAIIPGSGRLLYGRFYDAINSAFLIFGSAYLTYKHWNDTPFNYMFGGITASFYVSNIYGSYSGAVRANNENRLRSQFDAENIYYSLPSYLD